MKTKLLWALIIALVAIPISWIATQRFMLHVMANAAMNVRPFVMQQDHFVVQDGVEVPTAHITIARMRSGAISHSGDMVIKKPDGTFKTFKGIRRIDLPDGWVGMIMDSVGVKSTGRLPAKEVAVAKQALASPPANCVQPGETFAGEDVLSGQQAIRVTATGPMERWTLWRLPRFNCETAQATVEKRADASAPWKVTNITHLTAFQEVDPDPKLFTGFATFREMPPSQALEVYSGRKYQPTCKSCPVRLDDQKYAAAQH
ncbi:MAG TPA: hypothetical protein VGH05_20830 [Buttiauxella sp.]